MPEITKKQYFSRQWIIRFAFGLIIVAFYLFGLSLPLVGPDEPRYAQVAREMYQRGDWITPTLGGFNWFEKPALLYWLEIASYRVFGVSEFSARLGPALFGLGTILCLWILGRRISKTQGDGYHLGDWLALITASTIGIIVFSRGASFDIILTFPFTAALVCFYIFESHSRYDGDSSVAPLVLFYVFIGISLLAKGLVGIILPFGIVGLYFIVSRPMPSKTFLLSIVWGTLLVTIIAAIWYVPMYRLHGWTFIDQFIIQHHFQRFTSNKYQHPQPFYFFFWVLPLMTIPWLPFFLGGVWRLFRERFGSFGQSADTSKSSELSRLRIFAFTWMIVPVIFFSISGSKLPGYVLPALPGALILAVTYIQDLTRHRVWRVSIPLLALAVFMVLSVLVVTVAPSYANGESVKDLVATADAAGLNNSPVLMFHTVSHNAEFYAAGRILRESDGSQKRIGSLNDLVDMVDRSGGAAAVLMPIPYIEQMKTEPRINYQYLNDSGELAIVKVTLK
jgi:4-amino-4-deoxy-L-arabinose transferase-like glycosyltransferase